MSTNAMTGDSSEVAVAQLLADAVGISIVQAALSIGFFFSFTVPLTLFCSNIVELL